MKPENKTFQTEVVRPWANLIAILAAFAINIYANLAPPSGLTIGEISNTFFRNVLIIPANYAFAIWGLIYLGLISFGIYQVLPAQRHDPYLRRTSYLLVMASLAQIIWVFLFQFQLFWLSVGAMLLILLPLIAIYLRLKIGIESVSKVQRWLVHYPLSIYLAWISVATIVNVASALYHWGWNGWGISPEIWAVLMLVVGAALPVTTARQRIDPAFTLVLIWALVAVAVRQLAQPLITTTALGLSILLGLLLLVAGYKSVRA